MNCAKPKGNKFNFTIEQGATFSFEIVYKEGDDPVDLTGAVVESQLRRRYESVDTLVSLTSEVVGGGITLTPLEGKIHYEISAEKTKEITHNGVWDMLVKFPSGKIVKLLGGEFRLARSVTR